jgi:hypothetical protein
VTTLGNTYEIDYFPEGQAIKVETGEVDEEGRKLYDTYIKTPKSTSSHCGFIFPSSYKWQK